MKRLRYKGNYDYDEDAKEFLKWIEPVKGFYAMGYEIFKDDGSMGSSGKYLSLSSDGFYCSANDLVRLWEKK